MRYIKYIVGAIATTVCFVGTLTMLLTTLLNQYAWWPWPLMYVSGMILGYKLRKLCNN